MARLEVRSNAIDQAGVSQALEDLGLREVEVGTFIAEGEGRTLVRVLGAIRELERGPLFVGGRDVLTVAFRDPG